MDEKDIDWTHISAFLTNMPLRRGDSDEWIDGAITASNIKDLQLRLLRDDIDWSEPAYDFTVPEVDENRWITAIQKVPPKSGAFWYEYGRRYNEKVMMKIAEGTDPGGRRCCDVLVYTRRSLGDVVLSAWNEYDEGFANAMK